MIRRLLCAFGIHKRIPIRHTRHLYRCAGGHPGVWKIAHNDLDMWWEKIR